MDDEGGEDKMQDESSDPESDNKSDDKSLITSTTVLIPCSQPPSVQQPSHAHSFTACLSSQYQYHHTMDNASSGRLWQPNPS